MSKANVNIDDVTSFQNSIKSETETLNGINANFSQQLAEINEQVKQEKKKINVALDNCKKGINKLTIKIEELNEKLELLQAKLAATPPTITTTITDDEGNSSTVEEPNPEYLAIQNQIVEVEQKIETLENLLMLFEELQTKATQQIMLLEQVVAQLQELREEIGSQLSQLEGYSEEAISKLKNIEQTLQEYMDTKIETPDIGAKSSGIGEFLSNFLGNNDRKLIKALSEKPKSPHTIEESIKKCNPKYSCDSYEYSYNCQSCVPTYEMLRRGYSVTAKPRTYSNDCLAREPYNAWINPNIVETSGDGKAAIEDFMSIWGDGARAQVVVTWARGNGSGHTFVAEQIDGRTCFIDPQDGNKDCSAYFNKVLFGSVTFCRTDNLEPSKYIKKCMEVDKI